jgi:hypothetical protein
MCYKCYICNGLVVGGTRTLFAHLRSEHFACELPNVTLKCGQGDCVRCYSSFNSLAHHLKEQHSNIDTSITSINDNCVATTAVDKSSGDCNSDDAVFEIVKMNYVSYGKT